MKTRQLGQISVSAIGYGSMGFSFGYGPGAGEAEAIDLIRQAYEQGCTHFDTAEGYGNGENERLLGQALAPMRDQVTLATKFLITGEPTPAELVRELRGRVENSLRRLKTDYIDLYYQHRIPATIPVEPVAEVMGALISEGKIRGWGQSASTAEQIRAAHAIAPISAVQSEYSLMERAVEHQVLPTCEELGIGFVAYSPLANGFLSGRYTAESTYQGMDVRRVITRYTPENIRANQPVLDLLKTFAERTGSTPAQISLAWLLHKKPFIVPIPGGRRPERIAENLSAADTTISPDEFDEMETALSTLTIFGDCAEVDVARAFALD